MYVLYTWITQVQRVPVFLIVPLYVRELLSSSPVMEGGGSWSHVHRQKL